MIFFRSRSCQALAALVLTLSLTQPVQAEKLSPEWQQQRDYYNVLSDDACEGDRNAYLKLYSAAVGEDNAVAANDLAWLYLTEHCAFTDDEDAENAIAMQYESAGAGYPVAITGYAHRLMLGDGAPQDAEYALRYFDWAIELGYGTAAVALAKYYFEGEYIRKDYGLAVKFLRIARREGADPEDLQSLATRLDDASANDIGEASYTQNPRWEYEEGQAGWDYISNGRLNARVFVDTDLETGQLYYGLHRASNDPLIHFMGASVELSSGNDQELHFGRCGANNCLESAEPEGQTSYTHLRIPIIASQRDATLEAMKSGSTINFRYQTKDSLAQNKFNNFTLGLTGSRDAIEHVERLSAKIANQSEQPRVDQSTSVAPTVSQPTQQPNGEFATSGISHYEGDVQDGDVLCLAGEAAGYPSYFYAEIPEQFQGIYLEDPTKRIKPATTDFLQTTGATLWYGLTNGLPVILYRDGRAVAIQAGARNGVELKYEGMWGIDPLQGIVMRLSGNPSYNGGNYNYECRGGTLATDLASVVTSTMWKTCHMALYCTEWYENYDEKKEDFKLLQLKEWSPEMLTPEAFKWAQEHSKGR